MLRTFKVRNTVLILMMGWMCTGCANEGTASAPLDESLRVSQDEARQGRGEPRTEEPTSTGEQEATEASGPEPLRILQLDPAFGPVEGNTSVIITGTGFREGMTVLMDQSLVLQLFIVNPNQALFLTPPHPAKQVDMTAFHPDIDDGEPSVLESAFRYEAQFYLGDIEPDSADVAGGSSIEVTGSGFLPGSRLFIGTREVIAGQRIDEATLRGIVPKGMPGVVDVSVVSGGSMASRNRGFRYLSLPSITSLSPLLGPPTGGTPVRLMGHGLFESSEVYFNEFPATVVQASLSGAWLEATAPLGPSGSLATITVATLWGVVAAEDAWAWLDPLGDPTALTCTHFFPGQGPTAGHNIVTLACTGLQHGASVRFGGELVPEILLIDPLEGMLRVRVPPGEVGSVPIEVSNPFDDVVLQTDYEYVPQDITEGWQLTPVSGPTSGGTEFTIEGGLFIGDEEIRFGALTVTEQWLTDEGGLAGVTPAGSPGLTDVVIQHMQQASFELSHAFTYTDTDLELMMVTPNLVAQAGGTYLRIIGDGFLPDSNVWIGDEYCPLAAFISPAEVHVLSPSLPIGSYDVRVGNETAESRLEGFLTVYDPRSGYPGTWGGPVTGTMNVTVRSQNTKGPIEGAYIYLESFDGTVLEGFTDEEGQRTFSEPFLEGPFELTASAPDNNAYSILDFDALNVTVVLSLTDPPPPGPDDAVIEPPDATLMGTVKGIGKYAIIPPGVCDDLLTEQSPYCQTCEPLDGCPGDDYACVPLPSQGNRCLDSCADTAQCNPGTLCVATSLGFRCIPDPGEQIARCGVSNQSVFSHDLLNVETGWVHTDETFEIPSRRLGDVAIVCFGGFRDIQGRFTPTTLGVRRHVFAQSAAIMEGLDVELTHPLTRDIRLRLTQPPSWPAGRQDPIVVISLDLGSDGAIPMTKPLIGISEELWDAPRQLERLHADLYDASYTFYVSWRAKSTNWYPVAYHFEKAVKDPGKAHLAVFDGDKWTLEVTQLDVDFHDLWSAPAGPTVAVGERGAIILQHGQGWSAQGSQTKADLFAVTGTATDDIYAVGELGTVLHWDGLSWSHIEAPDDTYVAATTAPGQPLYLAGEHRIRRFDPDEGWQVEGPPSVQGINDLAISAHGHLAAVGDGGRLYFKPLSGGWQRIALPTEAHLNGVWIDTSGEHVMAVGDDGTLLESSWFEDGMPAEMSLIALPIGEDLYDVTVRQEEMGETAYVVGDYGRILRKSGDSWQLNDIAGYRGLLYAVWAPSEGEAVRAVGSSAHTLGPMLAYPVIQGAHGQGVGQPLHLEWSWDGGAKAHYSKLIIATEDGKTLWNLLLDGDQRQAELPNLQTAAGLYGVGSGSRRASLTRVLNHSFDLDEHTSRAFSVYRRQSWSMNRAFFYAP